MINQTSNTISIFHVPNQTSSHVISIKKLQTSYLSSEQLIPILAFKSKLIIPLIPLIKFHNVGIMHSQLEEKKAINVCFASTHKNMGPLPDCIFISYRAILNVCCLHALKNLKSCCQPKDLFIPESNSQELQDPSFLCNPVHQV